MYKGIYASRWSFTKEWLDSKLYTL